MGNQPKNVTPPEDQPNLIRIPAEEILEEIEEYSKRLRSHRAGARAEFFNRYRTFTVGLGWLTKQFTSDPCFRNVEDMKTYLSAKGIDAWTWVRRGQIIIRKATIDCQSWDAIYRLYDTLLEDWNGFGTGDAYNLYRCSLILRKMWMDRMMDESIPSKIALLQLRAESILHGGCREMVVVHAQTWHHITHDYKGLV